MPTENAKSCNYYFDSIPYSISDWMSVYESQKINSLIKKVIFNNPATIVYWNDGTKTVVKCDYNEYFDKEKGLAMAISKKYFDNKGSYYNQFKEWI